MNRTKIEEMLKVAEKEYSSVKFLSDSKSFMKMKIAQAKIQLLTSLLAEDWGEVKSLPDDIREFIRIATIEIQSHRSKSDEQLDSLFQKAYQLYSKYNVEASQQAPSADTCTEDKHIKGCKCEAPSATVDLPAIKTLFAKWCNAKTEDTHSNAMTLNAFAVAVTELLHSQQPTVDVDFEQMARDIINCIETQEGCGEEFNVNKVANVLSKALLSIVAKHEEKECRWFRTITGLENATLDDHKREIVVILVKKDEALRGSYSREDMIAFAHFMNAHDELTSKEALEKYDTERGRSNG